MTDEFESPPFCAGCGERRVKDYPPFCPWCGQYRRGIDDDGMPLHYGNQCQAFFLKHGRPPTTAEDRDVASQLRLAYPWD